MREDEREPLTPVGSRMENDEEEEEGGQVVAKGVATVAAVTMEETQEGEEDA